MAMDGHFKMRRKLDLSRDKGKEVLSMADQVDIPAERHARRSFAAGLEASEDVAVDARDERVQLLIRGGRYAIRTHAGPPRTP